MNTLRTEEEVFEEMTNKQLKLIKKILLILFLCLGLVYYCLGIIFIIGESIFEKLGLIFFIVGTIFLIIGVLLYYLIPKKMNYEKYKKRVKKYSYLNPIEIIVKNEKIENEIELLKTKINKLEKKSQDEI